MKQATIELINKGTKLPQRAWIPLTESLWNRVSDVAADAPRIYYRLPNDFSGDPAVCVICPLDDCAITTMGSWLNLVSDHYLSVEVRLYAGDEINKGVRGSYTSYRYDEAVT